MQPVSETLWVSPGGQPTHPLPDFCPQALAPLQPLLTPDMVHLELLQAG